MLQHVSFCLCCCTAQVILILKLTHVMLLQNSVSESLCMYSGWFVPLLRDRLQICSNGSTTTTTSGLCFTVVGEAWLGVVVVVYILTTSKFTLKQVPTCDSAYSLRLYSAASLGHQLISTTTCYPTQLHYLDTEQTSSCPRLGSDKYTF